MLFSDVQKIKTGFSFGLLLVGSLGLVGCQAFASGVDAILKQDDMSVLTTPQKNAFSAFEQRRYSDAVALFQQAIDDESDPELKAKLYNGLGLSLNELNQKTEAIAAYQAALALNSSNAQIFVNMGIVQRQNGDYDDALKSYEMALQLDDQLATAYSSIGSLRLLQGRPKLAIESFKNAIALDGNIAVSYGNLALAEAMVGQFEQAQVSLAQAIALGYTNGDVIQSQIDELKKTK